MWDPSNAELERIVTFAGVIGGIVVSALNRHKIQEIKVSIDGRMDELLKLTRSDSEQTGATDERTKVAAAAAAAAARNKV